MRRSIRRIVSVQKTRPGSWAYRVKVQGQIVAAKGDVGGQPTVVLFLRDFFRASAKSAFPLNQPRMCRDGVRVIEASIALTLALVKVCDTYSFSCAIRKPKNNPEAHPPALSQRRALGSGRYNNNTINFQRSRLLSLIFVQYFHRRVRDSLLVLTARFQVGRCGTRNCSTACRQLVATNADQRLNHALLRLGSKPLVRCIMMSMTY